MSTTTGPQAKAKPTTTKASATPTESARAGAAPAGIGASAGAALRALNPVTIAKTILPVRQTPIQQIAFYGTVVALAGVGVIEAPLAAVVIGGHLLHRSRNPIAESVGEALDGAR